MYTVETVDAAELVEPCFYLFLRLKWIVVNTCEYSLGSLTVTALVSSGEMVCRRAQLLGQMLPSAPHATCRDRPRGETWTTLDQLNHVESIWVPLSSFKLWRSLDT